MAASRDTVLEMHRRMLRIRLSDERSTKMLMRGQIPGTMHTSIGQAPVDRLVGIHGARAAEIVDVGRAEPELRKPLGNDTNAIGAELATYTRYVERFAKPGDLPGDAEQSPAHSANAA